MLIFQGTDSLSQKMNPHTSALLDLVLLELESWREVAESQGEALDSAFQHSSTFGDGVLS